VRANGAGVLNQPAGLALDAAGRLSVTETENRRVSVFSADTAFLGAFGKDVVPDNGPTGFEECVASCKAGARGAGAGEFNVPGWPAHDCRGALYVPDAGNGRVLRFGEPGTPRPPCAAPAALSKPFGIMKVRRDSRAGRATLTVSVPWSAELRLHGPGIRPVTRQVEFARRVRLPVRPTRTTMGRLDRLGHTRVRASVTYWPWGGERRTKTRRFDLRLQSPSR
jgi:hypothetical protein